MTNQSPPTTTTTTEMLSKLDFDDMLETNDTARWLHDRAKATLVEAAATSKPLSKEETEGPMGWQLKLVDEVCYIFSSIRISTN